MANNNRFILLDSSYQVTADGTAYGTPAIISDVTWGGDVSFAKASPTLTEDEAGSVVHMFLLESYYLADQTDLYVCVSADTYNDVGIRHVNFYYGNGIAQTVDTITQRVMDDGTKVQGYWIRLDNSTTAPTGWEDRTLYAEAVPNDTSQMAARVTSRTIRVMENDAAVHKVTLNPTLDSDAAGNQDDTLHGQIARYNTINGTSHAAIEFSLTPGQYWLSNLNFFPSPDFKDEDDNMYVYKKIKSSTGNRNDVMISLCDVPPGTTADINDSSFPYIGIMSLRNLTPWLFKDVTLDMFFAQQMQVSEWKNVIPPLMFDNCVLKDSSMSYSKYPTGRPIASLEPKQVIIGGNGIDGYSGDSAAKPMNPYTQTLFRMNNDAKDHNVQISNSFLNTIVAGGINSILNCKGCVWWDTFMINKEFVEMGVNNFKMITTQEDNVYGEDLKTERMVTNNFGPSSAIYDDYGRYYAPYQDVMGEGSIASNTCEVNRVTWVGTNQQLYDTYADLQAASQDLLEVRVYLESAPVGHVPRYRFAVDSGQTYAGIVAGQSFYDFDFFCWRNGNALTIENRELVQNLAFSSSFVISWTDDRDWGGTGAYPSWPIYSYNYVDIQIDDASTERLNAQWFDDPKFVLQAEFEGSTVYFTFEPVGGGTVIDDWDTLVPSTSYLLKGYSDDALTTPVDLSSWTSTGNVTVTGRDSRLNRVIDGNGVPLGSYAPSNNMDPLMGDDTGPLDPPKPYMVFRHAQRYTIAKDPNEWSQYGLDFTLHSVDQYLAASGGSTPVIENTTDNLSGFADLIEEMNFQPGDRFCPIVWFHQDGFQTTAGALGGLVNTVFWDYVSTMQQQWLWQGQKGALDMVWSNFLALEPTSEKARYLVQIQNPLPMRMGFKSIWTDNAWYMVTAGRESVADRVSLFLEGSLLTSVDGNSSAATSPPGDFDVTIADSVYNYVGSYPLSATLVGRDNYFKNDNSSQFPPELGLTAPANFDKYAYGVNKYGVVQDGQPLGDFITNNTRTLNMKSLLPYDIDGNPRTENSIPGAWASSEVAGSNTYTMDLPFNRFRVQPLGNSNVPLVDGNTATISYTGELLNNDSATRTYTWILDGTTVKSGTAVADQSYAVLTADVGKCLTCKIEADGAVESVAFGFIKP